MAECSPSSSSPLSPRARTPIPAESTVSYYGEQTPASLQAQQPQASVTLPARPDARGMTEVVKTAIHTSQEAVCFPPKPQLLGSHLCATLCACCCCTESGNTDSLPHTPYHTRQWGAGCIVQSIHACTCLGSRCCWPASSPRYL